MERKREKGSKMTAGGWSIYTSAKTGTGASVSETHGRDIIGWWLVMDTIPFWASPSGGLEDQDDEGVHGWRGCSVHSGI